MLHPHRHVRVDGRVPAATPRSERPHLAYDPMSDSASVARDLRGSSIVYEVLLPARTREHFVESGDARAALAFGLRRTAAVATGAAAVMIAGRSARSRSATSSTCASSASGSRSRSRSTRSIVRPVLLPAAVHLLGRWSWWPTDHPASAPRAPRPASRQTTRAGGVS